MLVGGVAMALTGVGGPAGAAMIASAGVNIASAGVDFAAALNPDNQALGVVSNVLGVASMVTPQGAAKAAVKEVAEKATEELATHADDLASAAKRVIDTSTEAPTPPTQLVNDITAPAAAKPPLPGVDTPKTPNAPPSNVQRPGDECGCLASDAKGGVYQVHAPDVIKTGRTNDLQRRTGELRRRTDLPPHETVPIHRTDSPAERRGLENELREQNFGTADKTNGGFDKINAIDPRSKRKAGYQAAAQAHHEHWGEQAVERTSTPAERRVSDEVRAQAVTDKQRDTARDGARQANESSGQQGGDSGDGSKHRDSDRKKKKQSTNKKRRKGQK